MLDERGTDLYLVLICFGGTKNFRGENLPFVVVTHQNGHLHSDTQGLARSAGKTQRTGGDDRGKGQ